MMEPVEWREYAPPADLPPKDWALTGAKGRPKHVVKSFFLHPGLLESHNLRLQEKYARIEAAEVRIEEYKVETADLVVVAYGSSARVAKGLCAEGLPEGKVGLMRPVTLWPFPTTRISELAAAGKRFLVVEMSAGQMVEDVRLAVEGRAEVGFYGRMGGAMVTALEMAEKAREMLRAGRGE